MDKESEALVSTRQTELKKKDEKESKKINKSRRTKVVSFLSIAVDVSQFFLCCNVSAFLYECLSFNGNCYRGRQRQTIQRLGKCLIAFVCVVWLTNDHEVERVLMASDCLCVSFQFSDAMSVL